MVTAPSITWTRLSVSASNCIHSTTRDADLLNQPAFKQATYRTLDYLMLLGYTREQALLFLTAAPIDCVSRVLSNLHNDALTRDDVQHVASLVDTPNACVTMAIPVAIFDRDIMPNPDGLEKRDYGQCAIRSDGECGATGPSTAHS